MRGPVSWLALLPIMLVLPVVAAFAGPAIEISTSPPGARVLVNGVFTGIVTDRPGFVSDRPALVTFPKAGDYDVTLVQDDYVPLTVRLTVPLWGSAQKASFKLERVGRTEWLSPYALLPIAAPLLPPFIVALLMWCMTRSARVNLMNAWALGTMGAVIGLMVGLSQTPVVAAAIQFVLVFLTGLAGYWMGDKSVGQNGKRESVEVGAYLLNFAISFVVAIYLGGYYRDQDRFFTRMRATYWGLASTSSASSTAGSPATGQPRAANGPRAPTPEPGPNAGTSTGQSSTEHSTGRTAGTPGAPSPDPPPAPGMVPPLQHGIVPVPPPPGPGFIAPPVCFPLEPGGHC